MGDGGEQSVSHDAVGSLPQLAATAVVVRVWPPAEAHADEAEFPRSPNDPGDRLLAYPGQLDGALAELRREGRGPSGNPSSGELVATGSVSVRPGALSRGHRNSLGERF